MKKINLKLNTDEIGIIILSLESSKSLLVKTNDLFLLYTFFYKNDNNLEQRISLFTDKLDYVFMKNEYSLSYPYKTVLEGLVVIQNVQLESNRLHYNDKTFCINETSNCHFVYLTEELEFEENLDVVFYDNSLSDTYIESLHEKWLDVYKITDNSTTILLLNNDYEVIHLDN